MNFTHHISRGFRDFGGGYTPSITHTMAHELGHGIFGLDHIFSGAYGIRKGATYNLMDYTEKTPNDALSYHEWTQINQPLPNWSALSRVEEDMYKPWAFTSGYLVDKIEDNENLDLEYYTVAVCDGTKFALPSKAKMLRFSSSGDLMSFVIYDEETKTDELYHSFYSLVEGSKKKFSGFFKDLKKKIDEKGNENWVYNPQINKPYPNELGNIDKEAVYIPVFDFLSDDKTCYATNIYKVLYNDSENNFDKFYSEFKNLSEEDRIKDDYTRVAYYEFEQSYCGILPQMREFYLFMINYYDYFMTTNVSDSEKAKRKTTLYELLSSFDTIKFHGIDVTEKCLVEENLSSKKDCDIKAFMKNIKEKYDDIKGMYDYDSEFSGSLDNKKRLCITFDNYSVYQDFYLKQFSPVEENEPKCTKEQWEQDMNVMNDMVNKVKKKKEKDIYDFCNLVMNTCEDWLKTVDYKILQSYISFIVEETDKTILSKFNNLAENAVLKIMRSINVNDYKEFVNYLCSDDKTHGRLVFRFMNIFDDRHLGYGDDNYKKYVTQLIMMYKANRIAFLGDEFDEKSEYELDLYIKEKIINLSEGIFMAPEISLEFNYKTGNVSLYQNIYKWMSAPDNKQYQVLVDKKVLHGYENVNPFSPIYFKVNPSDPEFKNIAFLDEPKNAYYLVCPLIFLKYREDKVIQRNLLASAAIAGVAIAVVPAIEIIGTMGVKAAGEYILKKAGEETSKRFLIGALTELVSYNVAYCLTHGITDEPYNPADLLADVVTAGLQNIIKGKWGVAGTILDKAITCVSSADIGDLVSCIGQDETSAGKCFKSGIACATGVLFSFVTESQKFKDAIKFMENKPAAFVKKQIEKLNNPEREIWIVCYTLNKSDAWKTSMENLLKNNKAAYDFLRNSGYYYPLLDSKSIDMFSDLFNNMTKKEESDLLLNLLQKEYYADCFIPTLRLIQKNGEMYGKNNLIKSMKSMLKNYENGVVSIVDNGKETTMLVKDYLKKIAKPYYDKKSYREVNYYVKKENNMISLIYDDIRMTVDLVEGQVTTTVVTNLSSVLKDFELLKDY